MRALTFAALLTGAAWGRARPAPEGRREDSSRWRSEAAIDRARRVLGAAPDSPRAGASAFRILVVLRFAPMNPLPSFLRLSKTVRTLICALALTGTVFATSNYDYGADEYVT